GFGDLDLLAAPVGERDVLDDVVGHEGRLLFRSACLYSGAAGTSQRGYKESFISYSSTAQRGKGTTKWWRGRLFGRGNRRGRTARDHLEHLRRRADVGEQHAHVVEGGVVRRVGEGGVGVGHEHQLVVHLHGVARGGLAAAVGQGSGDDQGVDPARLQRLVQPAG